MGAGQVFDGPGAGGLLGGVIGPVEVEPPVQQRSLLIGRGCVVQVGLVAGVAGVAALADLHVAEPPRHHLAVAVDLASIGDGVVEVHEQPRLGRRVAAVDQHSAPLEGTAVVGEHFAYHR